MSNRPQVLSHQEVVEIFGFLAHQAWGEQTIVWKNAYHTIPRSTLTMARGNHVGWSKAHAWILGLIGGQQGSDAWTRPLLRAAINGVSPLCHRCGGRGLDLVFMISSLLYHPVLPNLAIVWYIIMSRFLWKYGAVRNLACMHLPTLSDHFLPTLAETCTNLFSLHLFNLTPAYSYSPYPLFIIQCNLDSPIPPTHSS